MVRLVVGSVPAWMDADPLRPAATTYAGTNSEPVRTQTRSCFTSYCICEDKQEVVVAAKRFLELREANGAEREASEILREF